MRNHMKMVDPCNDNGFETEPQESIIESRTNSLRIQADSVRHQRFLYKNNMPNLLLL